MHGVRARHVFYAYQAGSNLRRTALQSSSAATSLPIQPILIKRRNTSQQNPIDHVRTSNPENESQTQRGKPIHRKASLRRSNAAAASSSVQGSQAVQRSGQVIALCATEEYDIPSVAKTLQAKGYPMDPHSTGFYPQVVHFQMSSTGEPATHTTKEDAMGDVFVFSSGTIVAWDISEELIRKVATQTLLASSLNPHLEQIETEDLEFFQDASTSRSSISGDLIHLGTKPDSLTYNLSPTLYSKEARLTLTKIAFSSGLARSAKLAVLESSMESYFVSTRHIPTLLSRGSRLPMTRSMILRKTGEVFSVRAQLNLYSELTDSLPDLFWDSRSELGLEEKFEQIGRALDVGVRIRALNSKLDYAGEMNAMLREKLSEQSGMRVEWLIAALISLDIILGLVK